MLAWKFNASEILDAVKWDVSKEMARIILDGISVLYV